MAQTIVADIPEEEAAKLANTLNRKALNHPALQNKCVTITKKDAPAKNAHVMKAIDELCPDIGPYAKWIL